MVKGYYHQLVAALKNAGYEFRRRGKGDHEIWYHPDTRMSVAVDRNSLSRHLANAILKQAGINRHF